MENSSILPQTSAAAGKFTQPFPSRPTEKAMVLLLVGAGFFLTIATSVYQYKSTQRVMLLTNRLCTFAMLTLLLASASFILEVFPEKRTQLVCDLQLRLNIFFFFINRSVVFTLLWRREKSLHKQTAFMYGNIPPGAIKCLQYFAAAGNAASFIIGMILGILSKRVATTHACIYPKPGRSLLFSFGNISFTAAQLVLVFLTIIPLVNQKRFNKKALALSVRLSVLTAASVLTDILSVFLAFAPFYLLKVWASTTFWTIQIMYNLLFNNVCLLLTFQDWRKRFMLPSKAKVQPQTIELEVNQTAPAKFSTTVNNTKVSQRADV